MRFLAALSFLTAIPLPRWRGADLDEIGRSTVYFPVVGAIIGLILAGLNWLLGLFLPQSLINGLLIVSLVVISGALHLDGFVDTCDGIAGHKSLEERWRVMRDSHAGAFGIIGVFLLLLIKYVSLGNVPPSLMTAALILMPVLSRWTMVYALVAYPSARPDGLGSMFKQGASWGRFSVATAITLVITIGLTWLAGIVYFYLVTLVLIFGSWIIALVLAIYFKRKFSGLSGDTYGAINEVIEVVVLVLIGMLAYNQWFLPAC